MGIIKDNDKFEGFTLTPKKVEDRTNADLLELVLQLHSRSLIYETKEMHDAYMEARFELEKRLK